MFDRDGMWEMNKAHHRELLNAAAKHRLLSEAKNRQGVSLRLLGRLLPLLEASLRGEFWSARRLNRQGTRF